MQARRKSSKIMSFLIPLDLLADVDEAVASQQANTLSAPLSGRSEWIIRAIRRELHHRERSRYGKKSRSVPQRPVSVQALDGEAASLPGKAEGIAAAEAYPQRPALTDGGTPLVGLVSALQEAEADIPIVGVFGNPASHNPTQSPGNARLPDQDRGPATVANDASRAYRVRLIDLQYLQEQ